MRFTYHKRNSNVFFCTAWGGGGGGGGGHGLYSLPAAELESQLEVYITGWYSLQQQSWNHSFELYHYRYMMAAAEIHGPAATPCAMLNPL